MVLKRKKVVHCQYFGAFACPDNIPPFLMPADDTAENKPMITDGKVCYIPCCDLRL